MVKWDLGLDGDLMEVFGDLVKEFGQRLILRCFGVMWECFELNSHARGVVKRIEMGYLYVWN